VVPQGKAAEDLQIGMYWDGDREGGGQKCQSSSSGPRGQRERERVSMHREMWNSEPERTFRALPLGPKNVGRGRRKELAESRMAEQSAHRLESLDPSATLCQSSRHRKVKNFCFYACPSSFRAGWILISSFQG
jgi:hypothetical protein